MVLYNAEMEIRLTDIELRKAKRYDSLLFTYQRLLVKSVRQQEEIDQMTALNNYYRDRIGSLERIIKAKNINTPYLHL